MFDCFGFSKHNIHSTSYDGFPAGKLWVGAGAAGGSDDSASVAGFQSFGGGVSIARRYSDGPLMPRKTGRPATGRKQGIPQSCGECGRTYYSWPSYIKRRSRAGLGWCSRQCAGAHKRRAHAPLRISFACLQCQRVTSRAPSQVGTGRFCSLACGKAYRCSIEHFESFVTKTDSCWLWTGGINAVTGYGAFYNSGHGSAHRSSWVLYRGPIPAGKWVLHRCDNPPCVNPDHLFLGTAKDNVHDSMQKGRRRTATVPSGLRTPSRCVSCGAEFQALASSLAKGHAKSCSRACHLRRMQELRVARRLASGLACESASLSAAPVGVRQS